jgi:uncharacterized protein YbjQ (UPF0145 family)
LGKECQIMDGRTLSRTAGVLLTMFLACALVLPQTGCVRALATAFYIIKGTNVDAEFDGLKDKKVAVVCKPPLQYSFTNSNVANDLAKKVGDLLAARVRKIEVIDHDEVAEWVDENSLEEFTEIGKALKADMVVGVELDQFGLYQGQTLYQGTADVRIQVYDLAEDGSAPVFQKHLPGVRFPTNSGIPTDRPEASFRMEFLNVLADQIGRHFYDHDNRGDFAGDTNTLE